MSNCDVGISKVQIPDKEVENSYTPYEGQIFEILDEAKEFYKYYGRVVGFGSTIRSTQKRKRGVDKPDVCVLCCERYGQHKKVEKPQDNNSEKFVVKKRNTSTIKCGCKAQLRLSRRDDDKWRVVKFDETHNHNFVTPSKRFRMKVNRNMPKGAKDLVDSFREENLPVGKVASVLDGEIIGFDERDCYNHLRGKKDYKTPIDGDATTMLNYFKKNSIEDPQFFYAIQPDSEGRAVNFFWVNGRSRMQYQNFGDVIYFDTTYKKNVYSMPFAPFTGVNHHLQSIQFVCALLLNETEDSFVWAFETFLGAMGGRAPNEIITDQDRAMGGAIGRVFSNARHRFCLWHILKKFPNYLSHVYFKKSKFKKDIKWCIRGTYRISDFEVMWKELLEKYGLVENAWLKELYAIREKWIPVYHLNTFYAGMNTTGRSEGMNSFYKDFFTYLTTLKDFAYNNEKCLKRIATREKIEDHVSEHKDRIVEGDTFLLKHAAKVYTKNVYIKLKTQWDKAQSEYKLYDSKSLEGGNHIYTYKSRKENDNKEWVVKFNSETMKDNCECKYFEFMGLPCGHILKVFQSRDLDEIPEFFIVKRWLQGANEYRAKYDGGLVIGHQTSQLLRTTHLTKVAIQLAYEAAEEDETYTWMIERLDELSKELKECKQTLKSGATSVLGSNNVEETIIDDSQIPFDDSQAQVDVSSPVGDLSQTIGLSQPLVDVTQTPLNAKLPTIDSSHIMLKNPRKSKPKGRPTDDHKSSSSRIKAGIETSRRKKNSPQGRQCKCCLLWGTGHDKRNCPDNPNRKTK